MPPRCVVPNCQMQNLEKNNEKKISLFKVPKDDTLWKKWEQSIPGIKRLTRHKFVCERHFEKKNIIREFIKYNDNNELICKVPLQRPHLCKGSIPTVFKDNFVTYMDPILSDHSYSSTRQRPDKVNHKNFIDTTVIKKEPVEEEHISSNDCFPSSTKLQEDIRCSQNEQPTVSSLQSMNVNTDSNVDLNKSDQIRPMSENMKELLTYKPRRINVAPKINPVKSEVKVSDSIVKVTFNGKTFNIKLPKPWNICKSRKNNEEVLLFTYAIQKSNKEEFIFEKTVIVDTSGRMYYQIYSMQADISETNFPRAIETFAALPELLKKFRDIRVCKGLNNIDLNYLAENSMSIPCVTGTWRNKDCKMISLKADRCSICKKYFKCLQQRIRRYKNRN